MSTGREYATQPLRKSSIASLAVLLALLPLGALLAAAQGRVETDVVQLLQMLFVSLLPVALLVPALFRRHVRFDGRTLTVKSAYHTRRTGLEQLDLDGAEIVDLRERKDVRPFLRMFGFSLIGFRAGHYRLRNRRKAFALVTQDDRVLVLPERGGTLLLLSVERPQPLLDDLRAAAAKGRGQSQRGQSREDFGNRNR